MIWTLFASLNYFLLLYWHWQCGLGNRCPHKQHLKGCVCVCVCVWLKIKRHDAWLTNWTVCMIRDKHHIIERHLWKMTNMVMKQTFTKPAVMLLLNNGYFIQIIHVFIKRNHNKRQLNLTWMWIPSHIIHSASHCPFHFFFYSASVIVKDRSDIRTENLSVIYLCGLGFTDFMFAI